jgi:hypothetical protein
MLYDKDFLINYKMGTAIFTSHTIKGSDSMTSEGFVISHYYKKKGCPAMRQPFHRIQLKITLQILPPRYSLLQNTNLLYNG